MVELNAFEATEVRTQWESGVDLFEEALRRYLAQSRGLGEAKLHARVRTSCFPSCSRTCFCREEFALSDSGFHPKGFEASPPTRLNGRASNSKEAEDAAMGGMPGSW